MSLLDDLRKKLDASTFEAVTEQLGDDFNFDVVPRSRLNEVIKQRDTYRSQVTAGSQSGSDPEDKPGATKDKGKSADKPVDESALRAQFEQEKQEAIRGLRIEFAVLDKLREAGAHDPSMVWGIMDKKKITMSDSGEVSGVDEQIEAYKQSKGFLFGATSGGRSSAEGGTGKQGGDGNGGSVTKEDFLKMSYDEQVKFKASNPEVFKTFLEDM